MRFITRILLFTTLFVTTVYCQGGGGGFSGGGSSGGSFSGGGFYGNRGKSCTSDSCRLAGIIIGSVLGGIVGVALLIAGIACCRYLCIGKPLRSNSIFVIKRSAKTDEPDMDDMKLFRSGFWTGRYYQYNKWHGCRRFSLSFDPLTLKVTGSGSDDVGTYVIDGTYSPQSRRIGLTKKYKLGTGNPLENLGHTVTIQLEWNSNQNQFEGKWYVRTKKYTGEDKFELKFNKQEGQLPVLPVYEKV